MKSKVTVFLLSCLFAVGVLGCDKIKPEMFKKAMVKKSAESVTVKGPVVARISQ